MFKFNRLGTKMTVFIVGIVLIGMLTTQLTTTVIMKQNLEKDTSERGTTVVEELGKSFERELLQYEKDLKLIGENSAFNKEVLKDSVALEEVSSLFKNYTESNSQILSIYVGFQDKSMLAEPTWEVPADYDVTQREWYINASKSPEKVIWSEPYIDADSNVPIITAAKAIVENGKVKGVLAVDLSLENSLNNVKEYNVGYKGYAFLVSDKGVALYHPTLINENLKEQPMFNKLFTSESSSYKFNEGKEEVEVYYYTIPNFNWKVGAVYNERDMQASIIEINNFTIAITFVVMIVLAIILFILIKRISNPLVKLSKEAKLVAEGDLTVDIKSKLKDEIGQVTNNFNSMVKDINNIVSNVQKSIYQINSASENLSAISEETTASTEEINAAVAEIARDTSNQAETIVGIVDKVEKLNESIEDINNIINKMNELSNSSTAASELGLENVSNLNVKINENTDELNKVNDIFQGLVYKLQEIDKVIDMITNISDQTNLLALNASIEAARAGEAGRGFAVVAEEVRKLAEQSSDATNKIKESLSNINKETNNVKSAILYANDINKETAGAVLNTEQSFNSINDELQEIVELIRETSRRTEDINNYSGNILGGVEDISNNAQQNASTVEEVSASIDEQSVVFGSIAQHSEELAESCNDLSQLINHFKVSK
ncbi:methyl-accepting chemotaxis protein [Clostridium sp.]|uniref:methyl-accepting chemotaxis protein n=1 Tax=Clostridium sp. TaxID=1506 RepID=UPI003217F52A